MFIPAATEPDEVIASRSHFWMSKPGLTPTKDLYFVKVVIAPHGSHPFHMHPEKEEILYVLSGKAEQWVEEEKRLMGPGDSVFIPKSVIHGTYNPHDEELVFLAIIAPGSAPGEVTIDMSQEEPWKSLR